MPDSSKIGPINLSFGRIAAAGGLTCDGSFTRSRSSGQQTATGLGFPIVMPPMALRSRSEIHPQEGQKWARFLRIAALLLRKLQPHLAVTFRIVAPAPAHLHEEEQMHGVLYNCDNVAPRLGADRLDGLATLSQHDLALALALD